MAWQSCTADLSTANGALLGPSAWTPPRRPQLAPARQLSYSWAQEGDQLTTTIFYGRASLVCQWNSVHYLMPNAESRCLERVFVEDVDLSNGFRIQASNLAWQTKWGGLLASPQWHRNCCLAALGHASVKATRAKHPSWSSEALVRRTKGAGKTTCHSQDSFMSNPQLEIGRWAAATVRGWH